MHRVIFWVGWAILLILPAIFAVQIFIAEDLPPIEPWKWVIPAVALLMIYLGRNRDDVFKHHVA